MAQAKKQEGVDLLSLTVEQLKVMAYDTSMSLGKIQDDFNKIQQAINIKAQEKRNGTVEAS